MGGNKVAADGLKHRVYDINREDLQGKNCLTNFHGMGLVRDKNCEMVDTMQKTASSGDIQNLVKNLLVDTIASDITKQVKTIKRPKLDLGRLAELHGQSGVKTNSKGEKVERADHYEPAVQETV